MPVKRSRSRKKLVLAPPTPEQLEFGKNVRQCRKNLGWSQQRLATFLDYEDAGMISMIENGQRTPSLRRGMLLVQLFGLSLAMLFGLEPFPALLTQGRAPREPVPYTEAAPDPDPD